MSLTPLPARLRRDGLERLIASPCIGRARSLVRRLVLPVAERRCQIAVSGQANVADLQGQAVFVANHSSDLDTVVIFRHLPRTITRRLATAAAADRFFTSLRALALPSLLFNVYPVDRDAAHDGPHRGMSQDLLSRGLSLLIYPQGSRRSTSQRRFSTGPARLAATRGLPVVPITLTGTGEAWPVGQRRANRGSRVQMRIGRPLRQREGESVREFSQRVEQALAA